jgi:hypothetical protein
MLWTRLLFWGHLYKLYTGTLSSYSYIFNTSIFKLNSQFDHYEMNPLSNFSTSFLYSERQKYGINSLKIKQNFFQKNL